MQLPLARRLSRPLSSTLVSDVALFQRVKEAIPGGCILDADYYGVDPVTGKIADYIDRLDPTHTFHQGTEANQTAVPTPAASLRGRLAIVGAGNQHYTSTRAASSWTYTHNGNPSTIRVVFEAAPAGATRRILVATIDRLLTTTRIGFTLNHQANNLNFIVARNNATRTLTTSGAFAFRLGQTYSLRTQYNEGAPTPEYRVDASGVKVASGNSDAAPSASAPSQTMRIMANQETPADFFVGRLAMLILAPKVLNDAENQLFDAFLWRRFGQVAA